MILASVIFFLVIASEAKQSRTTGKSPGFWLLDRHTASPLAMTDSLSSLRASFRFPLPRQSLRLGKLRRGHSGGDHVATIHGPFAVISIRQRGSRQIGP